MTLLLERYGGAWTNPSNLLVAKHMPSHILFENAAATEESEMSSGTWKC
jgi:hypothetical protein